MISLQKSNLFLDVSKPRYVRVNTLKATRDEVIKLFRNEGWEFISFHGQYDEFLEVVKNLSEYQFLKDVHVKDLLVFPAGTEFYRNPLYLDSTIILQDKASCLPPLVLSPTSNSIVLDMCAAPGMKTTMMSALMRDKGQIYAVERNERRFGAMCELTSAAGCTNVLPHLGNSLELKSFDWINSVEMILVDPTCSGTGMTERAKLFPHQQTSERMKKLVGFQKKLLDCALKSFPSAKRVVYSTCSILQEENEAVVAAVLANFPRGRWKIVRALPDWPSRGSPDYYFGEDCITARPREDLCTGFFIALFEKEETGDNLDSSEGMNSNLFSEIKEEQGKLNRAKGNNDIGEKMKRRKEKKKRRELEDEVDDKAHKRMRQRESRGEVTVEATSDKIECSSRKKIKAEKAESMGVIL